MKNYSAIEKKHNKILEHRIFMDLWKHVQLKPFAKIKSFYVFMNLIISNQRSCSFIFGHKMCISRLVYEKSNNFAGK